MPKKKRKYTKGPAWFKAHSPKALAARKIKLVREIKYPSTNKFKKGDKVIFPSAMYSPLEVTGVWYDRRGYWLYELDGDKRRKYRENELEHHSVDRIREASMMDNLSKHDKCRAVVANRDLQIGVLKDKLHEMEKMWEAEASAHEKASRRIAELERAQDDAQMDIENQVHNYREMQADLEQAKKDRDMYHDACNQFSNKLARYKGVVDAFLEGKIP